MNGWTDNELASIGAAHEVGIAPYLEDGTLRRYTIIWVVRWRITSTCGPGEGVREDGSECCGTS